MTRSKKAIFRSIDMKYTYRVVCYIDVEADDEEVAIELAEEQFPVEPYQIDLYEVEE